METDAWMLDSARSVREVRRAGSGTVCRPAGLACERGASSSCLARVVSLNLKGRARHHVLNSDVPAAVSLPA
jgi:hypothetical protein